MQTVSEEISPEVVGAELLRMSDAETALQLSTEQVQSFLNAARSKNTTRGYRSAFGQFSAWCGACRWSPLPASPETIVRYISAQAGRLKATTLAHHLFAIAKAHRDAGFPSPVRDNQLIAEALKGIKRTYGSAIAQKSPVLTDDLRAMLRYIPDTLQGLRDRALLTMGFLGAFRRSELVALDAADVQFTPEGLLITLRRSKTDQLGEGRKIAIPHGKHETTDAVRALQMWLSASGITEGPIFRQVRAKRVYAEQLTAQVVALLVKKYIRLASMNDANFSGHSLRAGFVTSAARNNVPERVIMKQTGHKSVEMVLRYVRNANAFTENACLSLGL
ncbi:MAG TPA: tyrosine-type recombinase/integrase [Edaphobacter sp.]|nr:tyrosine-type recombinase/integrase [Edaphobacter sp.]